MSTIKRISYFTDKKDQALRKIRFSWMVTQLLCNEIYRYKKRIINENEYFIEIFNIEKNQTQLEHRFRVKNGKIFDMSCNKNCEYLYALAIKQGWLILPDSGLPVTKWKTLDEQRKTRFRLNFNYDSILLEYRDKYGKKLIDIENLYQIANSIFDLQNRFDSKCQKPHYYSKVRILKKLIEQGDLRWLNLKPFRSVDISPKLKNALRLT